MRWWSLVAWLGVVACAESAAHDAPPPPPPPAHDFRLPRTILAEPVEVEARLAHASHAVPAGAPHVVVHAPAGLDTETVDLVVYLHGWESCARAVVASKPVACQDGGASMPAWGLARRHDDAFTNSVFVVPQLAWLARSGEAGRFGEPGFASAWLAEITARLLVPEVGLPGPQAVRHVVLAAHSGGYRTAQTLLRVAPDLPVSAVVFLDGLYDGAERMADWVAAGSGRRVVSLHTPHRTTTSQSLLLARLAARELGPDAVAVDPPDLGTAIRRDSVVVALSRYHHGALPAGELDRVLSALDLAPRGEPPDDVATR